MPSLLRLYLKNVYHFWFRIHNSNILTMSQFMFSLFWANKFAIFEYKCDENWFNTNIETDAAKKHLIITIATQLGIGSVSFEKESKYANTKTYIRAALAVTILINLYWKISENMSNGKSSNIELHYAHLFVYFWFQSIPNRLNEQYNRVNETKRWAF